MTSLDISDSLESNFKMTEGDLASISPPGKIGRVLDGAMQLSRLAVMGLMLGASGNALAQDSICGPWKGWTSSASDEAIGTKTVVIEGTYTPDHAIQKAQERVKQEGVKCGDDERKFTIPTGSIIQVAYPIPFRDKEIHYEVQVSYHEKTYRLVGKWYGFQNSSPQDREPELQSRCSASFERVYVTSGTTFDALCSSLGKTCVKVCDWEGDDSKSCGDSPYNKGDGSRIALCQ